MLQDYLTLMRPHQYVKNLVLFAPAFFALRITEGETLLRLLLGFIGFSLVASAVYILNDYLDQAADQQHPVKRHRPLASGRVRGDRALLLMSGLLLLGVPPFYWLDRMAFYLVSGYVFMNVLYSFRLKHVPILDLFLIALGFLIRIGLGAALPQPHVPLTMWIVLIVFLGALFLGLAKRRDDVLLAADGQQVRKAIDGYNLEFINIGMSIMASVLVVAYISYTISPEVQARFDNQHLYLTVFFVLLGVLRYLQVTFVEARSGSPSRLFLSDLFLQLTVVGWVLAFVVLLYL
mgnify:CR=1 FL=1